MLQNIRDNSQSIVAKIIVGFIVLTFALWGVDSLVGLTTQSGAPVTVNGVDISERQVMEGVEFQRRQILAQLGADADPSQLDDNLLRGMVTEGLIDQELLLQSTQRQGMRISDGLLDEMILATKEFQTDGVFDRSLFESRLRNIGLTPLMYRDYLRREKLIEQERNGLLISSFSLEPEMNLVAQLDRQTRDLQYLTLPIADIEAAVEVSDAEIEARYEDTKANLQSPEQVSISYLEVSKASLLDEVEVDESELQTQFEQLVAGFESSESRQAAHILIEFGDDDAKAQEQIQELAAQLATGADFTELAMAHSQDLASAEMGGDLGFMERGVFVPEFEDALYALNEGEVSEPVKTEFGYHLIKLLAIDRSEPPAFEEVKAQLISEQREQKAEALYVERSERLADLGFSSGDLREPADVLELEIKETGLFSREGGEDELSSHPRVLQAAFDPEVLENGNNSDLIELTADRSIVLRVKEHRPSRTLELNEVRDELLVELKREKAQQQLKEQGEALLAEIRAAKSLEAAETDQFKWVVVKSVDRGSVAVEASLKDQAFRMPKPQAEGYSVELVELANGDLALLAVTAVTPGPLDQFNDEQLQALENILAGRTGQSEYQDLLESLKDGAEIERL